MKFVLSNYQKAYTAQYISGYLVDRKGVEKVVIGRLQRIMGKINANAPYFELKPLELDTLLTVVKLAVLNGSKTLQSLKGSSLFKRIRYWKKFKQLITLNETCVEIFTGIAEALEQQRGIKTVDTRKKRSKARG